MCAGSADLGRLISAFHGANLVGVVQFPDILQEPASHGVFLLTSSAQPRIITKNSRAPKNFVLRGQSMGHLKVVFAVFEQLS
jgi:hypothetical protein